MNITYELQISCDSENKAAVERLLGKSHRDFDTGWHLIVSEGSDEFNDGLSYLIKLIETHSDALQKIGISTDQILSDTCMSTRISVIWSFGRKQQRR